MKVPATRAKMSAEKPYAAPFNFKQCTKVLDQHTEILYNLRQDLLNMAEQASDLFDPRIVAGFTDMSKEAQNLCARIALMNSIMDPEIPTSEFPLDELSKGDQS